MNQSIRELQEIPGVGKAIAQDLWQLGIRSVQDLKDQDPEALYRRLCAQEGTRVGRYMLYVFRCAVYYASTENPESELLKWWNWKDKSTFERWFSNMCYWLKIFMAQVAPQPRGNSKGECI
jgi:hypothetical protein